MWTGRGDGSLEVRPLSTGRNPFKPGDIMVTSGTGGLYRPNIPVAIVLRIDRDAAIAVPLANPAKVETVIVQHIFQQRLARPVEEQNNEAVAQPSPEKEKP